MSSALISTTRAFPIPHTNSALVASSSSTAVTASTDPDFNRMAARVALPQNSVSAAVIPVVNRMAEATRNILIRSADERDALTERLSAEQSRREESDRLHEAQRQADAKLINELRASLAAQEASLKEEEAAIDTMTQKQEQQQQQIQQLQKQMQEWHDRLKNLNCVIS
jgi:chromosome segregation ATPase